MKIEILAADSMGVRSMATKVHSNGISILIDPSCALSPRRFNLPPHKKEIQALIECWSRIETEICKAQCITITHFHFDHYNPRSFSDYRNKHIFLKSIKTTNRNQKVRGENFIQQLQPLSNGCKIFEADLKSFEIGKIKISFSAPFSHGPSGKLGKVIQVLLKSEEKSFLFTSDIQGFWDEEAVRFALNSKPDIIFLDGPPTYLREDKFPLIALKRGEENLCKIFEECSVLKTVILDHHSLRDKFWKNFFKEAIATARKCGKELLTAAQFMRKEETPYESQRKELYQNVSV